MTKRLKWEVFPGRNRFCCNGRVVTAYSLSLFYLTIVLILLTYSLFLVFDCPYLYINIGIVIPIVAVLIFVFTMACFFRAAFSDPGIIPRAKPEEAAYTEQFILQWLENGSHHQCSRPPPRTKEIFINNQPVKLKYCYTCGMFRPPRASHCSVCDNCVDCFDHHCPWVGNCVGRRNYRFFYLFIVSLSILCIYVLACSLTHIILLAKEKNVLEACKKSPASIVVFLICFISVWSILGLAGFHTFLTAVNLTTNEDLKGTYSKHTGIKNPYTDTVINNCLLALCGPIPTSLIDARGDITPPESSEDLNYKFTTNQPNTSRHQGIRISDV